MLTISDQKTVWNSIERTVKFFVEKTVSNITITDALNMYSVCGPYLTNQEKKDVMHEGFNTYTHKGEALDAFSEWCDKKNIVRTNVFGRIHIAP